MFTKYFWIVAALAIGVAWNASSGNAATIKYDFGDSSQVTAGNYNNIIVNTNGPAVLSIVDSIDTTGASTGIGLGVSGFFPGSNTTGTTTVSGAAAIFDPQAARDNAFGHTGPFSNNPDASLATVSITGLNPALAYDFTFFGSRVTTAGDNREAAYAVAGANSSTVYLDAVNNSSNVAIAAGIMPTPTGTISIQVSAGPNNNNASKFYYLGAMQIEYVPEPATLGLLCLALVGVFGLRRRT